VAPANARADADTGDGAAAASQRIDKWLWYARFVKSRTGAARLVTDGKVRVNRNRVSKPGHTVAIDDVLTFTLNRRVRVIRVLAPGTRRGPAMEAQTLYEDLSPEAPPSRRRSDASTPAAQAQREAGAGRPTKKQRRALDDWLGRDPTAD